MILTLYEPFRHWSETGSVYILSDPHFGDSDCKLMDPGWIEPEEQVDRINALVMKNDTFVCLGDVGDAFFVKQIRARKKILLLGNHDKKKDYKGLFDEIYDGPLLIAEKILPYCAPFSFICPNYWTYHHVYSYHTKKRRHYHVP